MSDADSGSKKKVKRHRGSASLSSMAWDNLWRNKKRTVTVICSLTLGTGAAQRLLRQECSL